YNAQLYVCRFSLPMIAVAVPLPAAMPASSPLHQVLAVLIEAADVGVLHQVLGLLLQEAEPVRQAEVLRAAIGQLLGRVPPASQAERPATAQRATAPPRSAKQAEGSSRRDNDPWEEPRIRLRAAIERGIPETEIAASLGLAPASLHRHLSRVRKPP